MKSLKLAVLPLMTLLAVPAEAAPRVKVILPEKTKNTCIRKVARLSSTLKYDAALAELAAPGCTQDLKTEEQLWVSLMEGVLYQALEQTPQAEDAFCRAFKQEELASLPIEKPSAELDGLFEKMRVECPDRNKAKAEQAEAAAAAAAAPAPVVAEVAPPPPAEPPPPVVETAPALSLMDSFELYASLHGEADVGSSGPLPLAGVNVNGSVLLPGGLRAGLGLTALASPRFSSGIGMLLADVRVAYPLLASPGSFGLQVFASGGPLMYGPNPMAAGGRAGLGVALDMSKVRVSLGGSYEWRSHYRLDYAAPMAWLEVGWKLAGR
ncbi:hypothetical protein NR798_43795 [Archangium gephyra]|uniref:hypothetical protein n=1 Tax=Archangium gephyra TaxID=48 RepID=UPI0035D47847